MTYIPLSPIGPYTTTSYDEWVYHGEGPVSRTTIMLKLNSEYIHYMDKEAEKWPVQCITLVTTLHLLISSIHTTARSGIKQSH